MHACSRCSGTGRLAHFSNVLGGTCFKCKGTGKQRTKPGAQTPKWAVFGQHRDGSLSIEQGGTFLRLGEKHAQALQAFMRKAWDRA